MAARQVYDSSFYDGLGHNSQEAVEEALRLILTLFPQTSSCVDVGCGIGTWLSGFRKLGVVDVMGLDGPWVPLDRLRIPEGSFCRCDFESAWPELGRRFDMALSLEVAEHLPPGKADGLVRFLCSLSDVVVFSAAIPGQGGTHHVNEQWPEYWAEKFRGNGYVALDAIRPDLTGIDDLPGCYKQNMFVAVKGTLYDPIRFQGVSDRILGMVHPELCPYAFTVVRIAKTQPLYAILKPFYYGYKALRRAKKGMVTR